MNGLELSTLSAACGPRLVPHGLSLRLAGGHVLALVDPNGTGKFTLIRVLSGVMPAPSGEARLDGVDLLRLSAATRAAACYCASDDPFAGGIHGG